MRIISIGLCVVAAVASITTAKAACDAPWFTEAPRSYCDGCTYHGTMTTGRNEPCERPFTNPGGYSSTYPVLFLGARITERAKHGIAGAGGTMVAYQPNKDFVGTDQFAFEMQYKVNGASGKFTARYNVTVK